MTLGEKVLLLRRRLQLSQSQLAQAAHMNPNTVAKLERGLIADPGGKLVLRLAHALHTTTDYLLNEHLSDPIASPC